ncbi:MAG: hypothetical protein HS115_17185 [Spirochaetales bacterium]|nr:hypothetical protein [Spirochaetales bacterium]
MTPLRNAAFLFFLTGCGVSFPVFNPAGLLLLVDSGQNASSGTTPLPLLIEESGGSTAVSEGGVSDTYSVVLTRSPTASVTVTITPPAGITVNGSSVAFFVTFDEVCPGANCWSVARTFSVAAVDDSIASGSRTLSVSHSTTATDPDFHGLSVAVSVAVTDNDSAAITVVESAGTTVVSEAGATDSYSVVLTSEPTADVLVYAVGDRNILVNGTTLGALTFTAANWNTPQNFTITAVNDTFAENSPHNALVLHSVSSSDSTYHNYTLANITVSVTDNDIGVILTESAGSTIVNEAALTDSYTLVLTGAPAADVDVTITPDSQIRVNGSIVPIVFTFNAGNWNVAQTVTVSGIGDALTEGIHTGIINHSVSSADGTFNNAPVPRVHTRINEAPPSCPAYHPDCVSNLALWVKADRAVTSGTKIERLHDLSLKLFFGLFQATVARQPDYVDGVLNGKPVMRFNGAQAILRQDKVLSLGSFTACAVYRASTTGFVYEHGNTSDSATGGSFLYPAGSAHVGIRRGVELSAYNLTGGLPADNVWKIVCHGYDGTHAGQFVTLEGTVESLTVGSAPGSGPGSTPLLHSISLGARGDAASLQMTGDIAEVLLYSSYLSATDREAVECYLANKYALTLSHGCP